MYGFVDVYGKIRIFKSLVLSVLLMSLKYGHQIVTWRGLSLPLVSSAFTGSSGIAGMTSFQTSNYLIKPNQCLLPAYSLNANSYYMGTRHSSWTVVLLAGSFLYETTLSGGDQGGSHLMHGWGMLIDPAKRDLKWKGSFMEAWLGKLSGVEVVGE